MFLGHYAVGFAAKRYVPRMSLGTLFLAVQWVDMLWPIMLLAGLEHVRIDPGNTVVTPLDFYDYPITHSALAALGWALAVGLVYLMFRRDVRLAVVVGLGVASHWVLDLIAHRPDLPLTPWTSGRYGLGLWQSLAATLVVELGLFVLGVALYVRSTVAEDRRGRFGLWSLVGFLGLVYLANVVGPPPPSERAIAVAGLALWLLVPWAAWIDRHRRSTSSRL